MHENYERDQDVKLGSERQFGVVFVVVFLLIGLFPLLHDGQPRWWSLGLAVATALVTALRPGLLHVFNKLWFRLGLLLHKIFNPVIMGLIFYLAVTPTALAMKVFGKDPMTRRWDKSAESYWVKRESGSPES